jgi:hypothetical protein
VTMSPTIFPPNQTVQSEGHGEKSVQAGNAESADDRVARYTLWLAILTGGLVMASAFQGYFLIRSDKTTSIAANAADLNARAALALQLPLIQVTPTPLGHSLVGQNEFCSVHFVDIYNRGETKAFPKEILYGWTVGDTLPPEPFYPYLDKFRFNAILEANGPRAFQMFLSLQHPLKPSEWAGISKGNYLWFYVHLIYDDFMGETRHLARCWRWVPFGNGLAWRPDETSSYNRKT